MLKSVFPEFRVRLPILLWVLILFTGCTSTEEKVVLPPDELLKRGIQQVKVNDYIEAKQLFQQILEDYPDSRERVAALIFLADTHYRDEEYEESKFHYKRFIELYPANKHVDRAHYFKAMSDFKMMEISTRDQTHTKAALEGFEHFIHNFPNSQYHAKGVEKRQECLNVLAENVFEIGKFYFRTGAYQSAIQRLRRAMEAYPDQQFIDEAIFLIAESYYNEENFKKAKDTYMELLDKYPRSLFAKEARDRLRDLR